MPLSNSITLTWADLSAALIGEYHLNYTYLGPCQEVPEEMRQGEVVIPREMTSYTVLELAGDTNYSLSLTAVNAVGESTLVTVIARTLPGG